ncbi:MAG: ABC transporter ATP-binding protein, partial [Gammaproteobacteria bacterium]|nr:ABC transporter ATP-binding protein [Gammaproteobacteria bacterium]
MRFLFSYIWRHKLSYGGGIAFIFVTNWLAVNIPLHIGQSIDLLTGDLPSNQDALIWQISLVVGFAVLMVFARTISRILFFNPARSIEREFKDDAFAKLTMMQKAFYDKRETGKVISIVNNDINGVRALCGVVILQTFNILFALSLTPYQMWKISPTLTLYCMLPVVVTFMMSHWAIKFMRDMTKKRMAELQTLSGQTVGILSGIEEIKSYQVQDWAAAEFDVHNEAILHRSMKITKIRTLVLPIIGYTDRIMKVLILAVGGSYLINADITIGELTALLSYATLLAMPFISLGMLFSSYQTCIVSLESMRSILDEEVPEQEFDNLEATEREALFKEGISAKNLSFTYTGDDKPTLNDINFTIRPGETVGILGKVGSGKSTLVNCLNRYLDVDPGQLFIDGHDVTSLSKSDVRSALRTITQEPFLFSDTVAKNIEFGAAETAKTLTLEAALKQGDMYNEVQKFQEKEQTLVGEKGILLSGGQKQRLSLARGMYTPSKLMMLDNVLSAVDNKTERFLLDQIFNNLGSEATLIISHRASVLEKVDRILVMDNGAIVDEGTHEQLLKQSDFYRKTYELQKSGRNILSEEAVG